MLVDLLLTAAGLVLLYFGAEWLVRGGTGLALRLGFSPLVIGLTVVAVATSSPEIVVSIQSGLRGAGDIAVGNVVGSNICNIGLILALTALIRPIAVRTSLIRRDTPIMIALSLLLPLMLLNDRIGRIEGLVFGAAAVGYFYWIFSTSRRTPAGLLPGNPLEDIRPPPNLALTTLVLAGGLAVLLIGARMLLAGGVGIATTFGISEAVIGLTLVAIGTSLPELATSFVAAFRGQGEMALGNAIGSNIMNLVLVLGIAGMAIPLYSPGISMIDLGFMIALALVLLPVLRTGFVISRFEGAFLLLAYLAYLGWLFTGTG
ncbi:MAG: sodium:calcium antiporter [Puniceicoccaceae bacterium]|nr:MAG: sodium:calcium antiporter [Puniceicoccaceae bacterium]